MLNANIIDTCSLDTHCGECY